MTPETKVKNYHRGIMLDIAKAACVNLRISSPETGGDPDFNYCLQGCVYWHIEFKAWGKKVDWSSRQGLRIVEMRNAGETVFAMGTGRTARGTLGKSYEDSQNECLQWFTEVLPTLPALRGFGDEPWVPRFVQAIDEVIQAQKTRQNSRRRGVNRPPTPQRKRTRQAAR